MRLAQAVGIVAALALMAGESIAAESRPNVVLIMADDFGYECVGANGGQSYRTPQLDRLAAGGTRFERCHVQPLCTPTRVQLMTGLYNVRNYTRFGHIDPQSQTFAHPFQKAGYATAVAGKWQLGQDPDLPRKLGFDEAFLWQHTRRPPRYANPGLEHNGVERDYDKGEYGPDLINDFAIDFVIRHKDRPFFLYYPMMLTHSPFQPTPNSDNWDPKARGEQANVDVKHFADMTHYMDGLVGRLVDKLKELGLRERTLFIFLGDNGTNPSVTSRLRGQPYRGGKGSSTARGTHVPLIVSWPGQIAAGKVNENLISSADFFPTLCEACELPVPKGLDGISFWPQLRGESAQPREILYCWYARNGGRKPNFEYAMTSEYKLYGDGRFFALSSDPFEATPLGVSGLTGAPAAAAKRLQSELQKYATARADVVASEGELPKKAGKKKGKKSSS